MPGKSSSSLSILPQPQLSTSKGLVNSSRPHVSTHSFDSGSTLKDEKPSASTFSVVGQTSTKGRHSYPLGRPLSWESSMVVPGQEFTLRTVTSHGFSRHVPLHGRLTLGLGGVSLSRVDKRYLDVTREITSYQLPGIQNNTSESLTSPRFYKATQWPVSQTTPQPRSTWSRKGVRAQHRSMQWHN